MDYLMDALAYLAEGELHHLGKWEAISYRHRAQDYDLATLLSESAL